MMGWKILGCCDVEEARLMFAGVELLWNFCPLLYGCLVGLLCYCGLLMIDPA